MRRLFLYRRVCLYLVEKPNLVEKPKFHNMKFSFFAGLFGLSLAMIASKVGPYYLEHMIVYVAFPSLTMLAAALDRLDGARLGSKIRFVGDMTYSTYLWHVLPDIGADRLTILFSHQSCCFF